MKQEIKERVEKIRNGEVPEGYKETKVGIIPDDWNVFNIDEISEVKSGKRLPKGRILLDSETPHPYIRVTDMYKGGVSLNDIKYVPIDVHPSIKKYRIFKKDIFISVAGTLGVVGIIPEILDGANLTENADRLTNISCNRDFLLFVLMSPLIQSVIESESTLGAQPKLALTRIRKFRIPLPKEQKEQQKIAEILSTWEKAIELKEKLIEEKKDFKRGLMQNIISDQMNYDYSWKFTKFKEIFKIIKRPIDKHPEEEYKRLTVQRRLGGVQLRDIKKGKEILVDSQHIVKEGDFIISKRQVFHGAIGVVQKKLENSIISMEYSILRCNEGFDTDFLFYCMYSPQFKKTIIKRTQGVHEEKFVFLFNEWYKTLGLHIPSIDEQKSTVSVLNNLNENIQILTNEVAQFKEQKRGLMQLLLTGIVRVEVN